MGLPDEYLAPEFQQVDGHFAVVFKGPGKSLLDLKSQRPCPIYEVAPAVIDILNANQRLIVKHLLKELKVGVPALAGKLKVSEQAVRKDMAKLQALDLVGKRSAARATYYVLKTSEPVP